jgi:hypothetical protein
MAAWRSVSSKCVGVRELVAFFFALLFSRLSLRRSTHGSLSAGGRSWSSVPATGTVPSTR